MPQDADEHNEAALDGAGSTPWPTSQKKRIEREVIFPNLLTLLVSAHGIFDPLADDFQAVADMNLQLAHRSPPAFRTSAKKSANSWSRLVNE
jgi:hypothetical protein